VLSLWPPDLTSMLYERLRASAPLQGPHGRNLGSHWNITPSYAHGKIETLPSLAYFSRVFMTITDPQSGNTRLRAQQAISTMLTLRTSETFCDIPVSLAAPLLEAARTMQIIPVGGLPSDVYKLTRREDCAPASEHHHLVSGSSGYLPAQDLGVSFRQIYSVQILTYP
jgi:hypothetical protein